MKTFIAFLLLASTACASPYLTCDPWMADELQPTHVELTFTNVTTQEVAVTLTPIVLNSDGSVSLWHDLSALPRGRYVVTGVAVQVIWNERSNVSLPLKVNRGQPRDIRNLHIDMP